MKSRHRCVLKVARELNENVKSFREKQIETHIPYLFVDASYFKARDEIRYVFKALLVVAAMKENGHREILGARVADAEHELTWEGILSELRDRGLCSVDLVISDGHTGIQTGAEKMFPRSSWQMCYVQFI
jgi:transposase-like protein